MSSGERVPVRLALSCEEAAAALGVSRPTVYRLLDSGRLTSIKVGRRRLIAITELKSFLQKGDDKNDCEK